jgi:hypothetical protein
MHPMRSTKRSLFFLAAGAAGAYLFDPQSGRSRREQLLAKVQQYAPISREPEQTAADADRSDAVGTSTTDTMEPPAVPTPGDVVLPDLARDDLLDNGVAAPSDDVAAANLA